MLKGYKQTEDHIKNRVQSRRKNNTYKHSEDTKRKMGLSRKGKPNLRHSKFLKNWWKEHPEEREKAGERIKKLRKNKTYKEIYGEEKSKEIREKQSSSKIGIKQSETHRLNNISSTREWHKRNRNTLEYQERYKKFGEKMTGHLTSEETRKKIGLANSKTQKGIPKPYMSQIVSKIMQERWKDEDFRKMMLSEESCMKRLRGLMKRPSSYEQKISDLCLKYNLPFIYTGNGKFLVGFKNPDFKHKYFPILIEVYNNFHHSKDYEESRGNYFKGYGFKTIFINEQEVTHKNWEQICLNKINEFCKNS